MTDYQFAKTYEGESFHCCLMMDLAIDEGYLHETFAFNFDTSKMDVLTPHISGAPLTKTGRKRKPNMLVTFCPWCGAKLEKAYP